MPRRAKKGLRRVLPPDARYNSVIVAKFINKIMQKGQKATAERIVYTALQIASQQLDKDPKETLEGAIKSTTPFLMVKSRRVGGATYQVPIEVEPGRGQSLAIRWLITSARARTGKSMQDKLGAELVDAMQGRGAAIKKRDDIHRMAEANKAFAHFRW